MNKLYVKIVSAALFIGLITGCSSKNENINLEKKTSQEASEIVDNVNNKVDSIKTNIAEVSNDVLVAGEGQTASVINGKTIILTSVHFGFDNYKLNEEMISISNDNADIISNVVNEVSEVKVKLEGNCDEWGTDEYNYALGLKRAKRSKNALIKSGISSDRIVVVSYGESNPKCSNQTAKCWKKNRRVDYNLLP
jgi:peptidoglycan-associated lipoprotein